MIVTTRMKTTKMTIYIVMITITTMMVMMEAAVRSDNDKGSCDLLCNVCGLSLNTMVILV